MAIEIQAPEMQLLLRGRESDIDIELLQGTWSEEQYLRLTDGINVLLEFTDGVIEVLPMPSDNHQSVLEFLFFAFRALMQQIGGKARFSPLRIQIRPGKYREPDIMLVLDANDPRRQNRFWLGADLVVEVVSPDKPERDTEAKRHDYAEASIPEYWIVNPTEETITVLALQGDAYATHGVFGRGTVATSVLLEGFAVVVDDVLNAE
jgi:Uma2 family endonuclease